MIDLIRSYHGDKTQLEEIVLKGDLFDDLKITKNPKTNMVIYPITSSCDGFHVSIDKYRAYINCIPKVILYNYSNVRLKSDGNLLISELKTTVKCINEKIDHYNSKLSRVNIGFIVPTTITGKDFIKLNILMHKYHYCNHDLVNNNNRGHTKEFVYENFKIAFDTCKNENCLKIVLKLIKSAEFTKYGINNVNDLIDKKKLTKLFDLFMKRFDELIIVDSFDPFEGKDYAALQEFLNYRYWKNLAKTTSRQTQSKYKKKFQNLVIEHGLDTKKNQLKKELNIAFTRMITN